MGYIYIFLVISINTVFAAVFLWILVNIIQSHTAFGCTIELQMIHKETTLICLCANF